MRIASAEELLEMLRHCASKLLLAYDATMRPDFWEAFEKTAQACETLAFQQGSCSKITYH